MSILRQAYEIIGGKAQEALEAHRQRVMDYQAARVAFAEKAGANTKQFYGMRGYPEEYLMGLFFEGTPNGDWRELKNSNSPSKVWVPNLRRKTGKDLQKKWQR